MSVANIIKNRVLGLCSDGANLTPLAANAHAYKRHASVTGTGPPVEIVKWMFFLNSLFYAYRTRRKNPLMNPDNDASLEFDFILMVSFRMFFWLSIIANTAFSLSEANFFILLSC